MENDLVIWWLDQADCEAIGQELPGLAPAYLMEQYKYRFGRPGRGRLWVDPQFGSVAVEPWPMNPLSQRLAACAGIVMRSEHLSHIEQLPGLVTDLQLHRPCAQVAK